MYTTAKRRASDKDLPVPKLSKKPPQSSFFSVENWFTLSENLKIIILGEQLLLLTIFHQIDFLLVYKILVKFWWKLWKK